MPRVRLGAAALVSALLVAMPVLSASPAYAHEQRVVNGFHLTIGWQHEPAYTGVLNAVQLFVHAASQRPVDDLGTPPSLTLTVSTGSQTSSPLELIPSYDPDTQLGTHGEFDAPIIPTAPGTYTFHLTGSLGGQEVDEKFTSSDSTFDNVEDPTAVQFPIRQPGTADLATNLSRLNPRVDNAAAVGESAHNKANLATTLAIVALIVGAVLGLAGTIIGVTGRRARRYAHRAA